MTTLFNAVLDLANELAILRVSTATGGSTTTIIDTKRTESVDAFNGGTAFIITDAGGASAAPEGEWARITDWNATTKTATIDAVTAAVASGDKYGFATGAFPLDVLISAINKEIIKYRVVRYDTTSLDFVSGQSEYTLPTGVRAENLVNVYESTVDDSNDNRWTPLNWHVQTADTGTQHTLVIDSRNVSVDNDIMLEYTTYLTPLYLATDAIDDIIPMARIIPAAAAHARAISMSTFSSANNLDLELLKIHREDAALARLENQIRKPAKRGNINEAAGG